MEIFKEIWISISRNKLRTSLTGFAVAWGIFMLIFLLGSGNGLINATMTGMNERVANSMQVFGGSTSKAYNGFKEGRPITLRDKDINTTRTAFPRNVQKVGGEIMENSAQTLSYGEFYVSPTIKGVAPEYMEIEKYKLSYGRFINQLDMREQRKTIVISERIGKELTPNYASLLGKYVKVNNFAFKVVGIYKEDKGSEKIEAFVPFSTFKTMYGRGDRVGSIIFTFGGINNLQESEAFEKEYRQKINANHDAAPDDNSAVWLWNRYSQYMQMSMGMDIIRTALWIIGLLTLLSGIVGISNIMLITVKERTHEFGIRKALGAKPTSILRLIIAESVIITTIFGYIGMMCGIAANEFQNYMSDRMAVDAGGFEIKMFVNPTVGLDVCLEATLIMIIAGTIAGLIPARKAAKVRPIEALRG